MQIYNVVRHYNGSLLTLINPITCFIELTLVHKLFITIIFAIAQQKKLQYINIGGENNGRLLSDRDTQAAQSLKCITLVCSMFQTTINKNKRGGIL